jgi:oligopeptide/dipeptide ABC transporter ATP-binding protein
VNPSEPLSGGSPVHERTQLLEVRDLRTHFPTSRGMVRAVDGISFSVAPGEAVGLVGESGSGKTVTALSVMGLLPGAVGRILPSSSIRLRGQELVGAHPRDLRRVRGREVAMIFQDPMSSLNPVMPVGEQVREALGGREKKTGREGIQRAVGLLKEVEIPDPELRYRARPHELSGGMRQRVMIAMALAGEPRLLIADEPTTALDVTVQSQILELLHRLRREREMALLLITHDLAVVAQACRRILVMYAGQLVETGGMQEVLRRPRHPYTQALLASVPRGGREELDAIVGMPPDPLAWPSGCRFRPRCPHAWERCLAEAPPLIPVPLEPGGRSEGSGDGVESVSKPRASERSVRCWLEEEGG